MPKRPPRIGEGRWVDGEFVVRRRTRPANAFAKLMSRNQKPTPPGITIRGSIIYPRIAEKEITVNGHSVVMTMAEGDNQRVTVFIDERIAETMPLDKVNEFIARNTR